MSKQKQVLGRKGEEAAVRFLEDHGYRILARNYRTGLGEIDIVASDKGTLCFIEVKTRNSRRFGLPSDSLTSFKQRQISKAALRFLKDNKLFEKKARFDVVSIIYSKDLPELNIIKNAFELSKDFTY